MVWSPHASWANFHSRNGQEDWGQTPLCLEWMLQEFPCFLFHLLFCSVYSKPSSVPLIHRKEAHSEDVFLFPVLHALHLHLLYVLYFDQLRPRCVINAAPWLPWNFDAAPTAWLVNYFLYDFSCCLLYFICLLFNNSILIPARDIQPDFLQQFWPSPLHRWWNSSGRFSCLH